MRKTVAKRIITVFGILLCIFAVINLAWLFLIKLPYDHLCSRSELFCSSSKYTENEWTSYNTYYDTENVYGYKIYKTEYLSFVGITMAIGEDRHTTAHYNMETGEVFEEEPPLMIVTIVRNLFGKYTYHLSVFSIGGENFDVTINRKLEIEEAVSEQLKNNAQDLINENRITLEKIMQYASEMWELR